ncbi:hypothetical protein Spb1_39900 [Planctopirus ephydatiae]|uniref:Uncharacterized protein n=1 Tax=Planctopirus ephydatiae TaxID=2528019 RepID=A0A518GTY2_9PLAN|nr:hypothetical protein Spb1_39900 [Planctopirus ephydatiae]
MTRAAYAAVVWLDAGDRYPRKQGCELGCENMLAQSCKHGTQLLEIRISNGETQFGKTLEIN